MFRGFETSNKIYYRYKIAHFFDSIHFEIISKIIANKIYTKYNCIISPKAIIEKGVRFPHPVGIVIGKGVKIGTGTIIYHNVTLGRKNRELNEYPQIGKNVIIYCNSTVIGKIDIGDNSIIGCNSVVLKSIKKNTKCSGVVK